MTTLKLRDYLSIIPTNKNALSKKLGVSQQLVSYWMGKTDDVHYISFDVASGEISRVWAEKTKWEEDVL